MWVPLACLISAWIQTGYEPEQKQKRLPSKWAPPGCRVTSTPTAAVSHGQWARRPLPCRDRALGELLASRWPWRHSPEDPRSRQGSHRGRWGLQPPKAVRQGPGHLLHCWGNNILFVFPQKKKKKRLGTSQGGQQRAPPTPTSWSPESKTTAKS